MEKRVVLPRDELPHKNQAIEWWYFNGFLKGKKSSYAFMTSLFRGDRAKLNLHSIKAPFNTIYFSHTMLFNLKTHKVIKEVLPFVIPSADTFKHQELFINYTYPLRKFFMNYEIARKEDKMRVKTSMFDLELVQKKKPLFEGSTGFIDLGRKSTYYYSYTNLAAKGYVGSEPVQGVAWHDKQWSQQGFTHDSWLWFSIQLPQNVEIVCFDYLGVAIANISYANGTQELYPVKFTDLKKYWTSKVTGKRYPLEWKIETGKYIIHTSPLISDGEMSAAPAVYWEGPVTALVNGKKAQGFMEILPSSL